MNILQAPNANLSPTHLQLDSEAKDDVDEKGDAVVEGDEKAELKYGAGVG